MRHTRIGYSRASDGSVTSAFLNDQHLAARIESVMADDDITDAWLRDTEGGEPRLIKHNGHDVRGEGQ